MSEASRFGPDSTRPYSLNEALWDLFQNFLKPQRVRLIGHASARRSAPVRISVRAVAARRQYFANLA